MTPTGLQIPLSQSNASADGSNHPRFCNASPLEIPKEVARSRIVCFNNMVDNDDKEMKDEHLTRRNEIDKRPALIQERNTCREYEMNSPGVLPWKMKRSRRC